MRLQYLKKKIGQYDGSAILFNPKIFHKIATYHKQLLDYRTQIAVIAILRHRATNKDVCFMSLHLKSGYADTEDLRHEQFESSMDLLKYLKYDKTIPLVIAGDMNSDALRPFGTLAEKVVKTYKLVDIGAKENLPTYNHWHQSRFDYIFTKGLTTIEINIPQTKKKETTPNEKIGSDHFPVSALLKFS